MPIRIIPPYDIKGMGFNSRLIFTLAWTLLKDFLFGIKMIQFKSHNVFVVSNSLERRVYSMFLHVGICSREPRYTVQKQSSSGVLRKRCSENM